MATIYLFDTNLFIEHLRNAQSPAAKWIIRAARNNITAGISQMTIIELWVGLKRPDEARYYKVLLAPFRQFDLNRKIAIRTAQLWRPYFNSGANVSDFLIGATAEYYHANIVTHNVKHFERMGLKNIHIIDSHN